MERTLEKMVGGSRASVLRSLEGGPRSVGDIVAETRLSQPNVSNHLARLRELGLVIAKRDGRRVYYRIISPDLIRALLSSPANEELSGPDRDAMLEEVEAAFKDRVVNADHDGARAIVDRALAAGLPWRLMYARVFTSALAGIAELRSEGAVSIAEEQAAGNLIERLMGHVGSLRVPGRRAGRCDVVVACPEGEHHIIGAWMASDFLSADGLNVAFFGADVPAEDLVDSVQSLKARALIVFATAEDRAPALRVLAARFAGIQAEGGGPTLFLGGRLVELRPGLAAEMHAQTVPEDLDALCAAVRDALA